MKKKFLVTLLTGVCALSCAFGLAACGENNGSGGGNNNSGGGSSSGGTDKVSEFIRVTDGVFTSAGYTKPSSAKSAEAKQLTAQSDTSGIGDGINALYNAIKSEDNTAGLSGDKLNYIKCDTLYQGANLAGLFKSMALTLGDGVFSNVYDLTKLGMPDTLSRLEADGGYTLYGVSRQGSVIASAIRIDFNEYATGKFNFKLAQYSKTNEVSELRLSYYDSASVAFSATLTGGTDVNFTAYDSDYDAFSVAECTIALFGGNEYVSDKNNSNVIDKDILKFAKESLNFNNKTYIDLAGLNGGKTLGDSQASGIYTEMEKNYYVNPYSGTSGDPQDPDTSDGVKSVTLNKKELTLNVGETQYLSYSFTPADAKYKTLTWTSSNEKVATVEYGEVRAVSVGTATVTLTTDNGQSARCKVTVVNNPVTEPDNPKVESIRLDSSSLNLHIGGDNPEESEASLTAVISPFSPEAENRINWTSSNEKVVRITGKGSRVTVIATGEGKANVTATIDGNTAYCTVTVVKDEEPIEEIESISLDNSFIRLQTGECAILQATVHPAHLAEYYPVTWSSQNESIATVNSNGEVTAVAEGITTITASAGGFADICTVRVEYTPPVIEVESITLDKTQITLTSGEEITLTATVLPENAADKTLTWTSSDWNMAQVDGNGHVTTRAVGTVTITAESANGVTASCVITVKPDMPVLAESVVLDKTELALETGDEQTLTATVLPENAVNKTITWTSSDEGVATVDGDGKVTAVGEGQAEITAKTGNLKTATCHVTVSKAVTAVESITLDQTALTLTVNGEATLIATVLPEDATDKTVTWTSSDESVATVDGDGKVTAVGEGSATITATSADGKISAACTVTVNACELEYTAIEEDGEVVAYSVSGIGTVTDAHVIIPSEYNGKPVTAIVQNAFSECENITSVTIPASVKTIGSYAFSHTNLNRINIASLYDWCAIDLRAEVSGLSLHDLYLDGEMLTDIVIPEGITEIKDYTFANCGQLANVNIPEGITSIGKFAFYNCKRITDIKIPESVKTIGAYAFYDCSLTGIEIPEGVTSIGGSAFYGCSLVTDIVIPESVTSIGSGAFYNARKLVNITVPFVGAAKDGSGKTNFGYIFGADDYSNQSRWIPSTLISVTVTGGSIAAYAFNGCSTLTEIGIYAGVTAIADKAFQGCTKLTKVKINDLSAWCGIQFASYDANPLSIAKVLYLNNEIVNGSNIPDDVTVIRQYAFYNCTSLTSVIIPDTVTKIEKGAFERCSRITSMTVPFLGEKASGNTNSNYNFGYIFGVSGYSNQNTLIPATLKTVTVTGGVVSASAFSGCANITDIILSDNIKSVGAYAFNNCSSLKSVTLPHGITKVDQYTFYRCSALTGIEIPSSVTAISDYAFQESGLVSIIIPETVTSVGYRAFKDCTSLKSIHFPKAIKNLQQGTLEGCSSLEFLSVPFIGKTRTDASNEGFIGYIFGANSYDAQNDYLPETLKTVAVTDCYSTIANSAFKGCSNIEAIMLSKTVTKVLGSAFDGCSKMRTVYYEGTSAEWNKIAIQSYNNMLESAAKYYYAANAVSGMCWHYDTDGVTPVKW